jgi:hypothetical protein
MDAPLNNCLNAVERFFADEWLEITHAATRRIPEHELARRTGDS